MKKLFLLLITIIISFSLFSCTSPEDLYGTWYVDDNGTRNIIQFSEDDNGKNVFIWAVYDIEQDSIVNNSTGSFKISGDSIKFEFLQGSDPLTLQVSLKEDTLTLSSDTAIMKMEKYVLE